ncbi:MAG: toxin-antitoxin system HicB family antitoxin [Roseiflexaceae bacterium]|nr:toxin-antitoxin system HicB family antitoxin [Roseiflexaceae bacterium]
MSDDADRAYALRLPMWLYKDIEKLAQREMRSVTNMIAVLLRKAIAERGMGPKDETNGEHQKARAAEPVAE